MRKNDRLSKLRDMLPNEKPAGITELGPPNANSRKLLNFCVCGLRAAKFAELFSLIGMFVFAFC